VPLSLNDAIKRALENNNDIEVARDDVRFAETQLRSLEGIFDPVFSLTPTYDKRISPQQSQLGGGLRYIRAPSARRLTLSILAC
jgi:outer membrane protein TolC